MEAYPKALSYIPLSLEMGSQTNIKVFAVVARVAEHEETS
jgi:hypothetical protein